MFEVLYDQAELGKRIKSKRKEYKMTQEDLAQKLEVSRDSISDYERGITQCGCDHLIKLCQIFNVSSDYFLFGYEKKLKLDEQEMYTEDELKMAIKFIRQIKGI